MKFTVQFTLITACFMLLITGCKKDKTPKDEFSFFYNGKQFHYSSADLIGSGMDVKNGFYGTPSVEMTLPGFDGKIVLEKTGCAYSLPKGTYINNLSPTCVVTYQSLNPSIPIDSSKIYQYSSGSFNLTSTNCTTRRTTFLSIPVTYTNCDVNGTFDIELTNRNNERIVIMNGIVRLHAKLM